MNVRWSEVAGCRMENDTQEAKVQGRFDVTLFSNPKTRKQCQYELVVRRLLEPKMPIIIFGGAGSPKTNCFTHGILHAQNSSIENYYKK